MNGPRTCLVTGATAGIGRATAMALGRLGHHVIVAARDPVRAEHTRARVAAAGAASASVVRVDLASQESTRGAAAEVRERFGRLDVLINNAGLWSHRRAVTADGIEQTWAVNVLAGHLLIRLLSERLAEGGGGRVVQVASGLARDLDLDDVQLARRSYSGLIAYAQSKQANRMLTRAFARRLSSHNVSINSVHPGFTRTGAFRAGGGAAGWLAGAGATLFGKSPSRAADTIVWLAVSDDCDGFTGGYFHRRRVLPCEHEDPAAEERLYALCEAMTGASAAVDQAVPVYG